MSSVIVFWSTIKLKTTSLPLEELIQTLLESQNCMHATFTFTKRKSEYPERVFLHGNDAFILLSVRIVAFTLCLPEFLCSQASTKSYFTPEQTAAKEQAKQALFPNSSIISVVDAILIVVKRKGCLLTTVQGGSVYIIRTSLADDFVQLQYVNNVHTFLRWNTSHAWYKIKHNFFIF